MREKNTTRPVYDEDAQRWVYAGEGLPSITGVDTEQRITRRVKVDASDGAWDHPVSYRQGTYRPYSVKIEYRVNRGASEPFWYVFEYEVASAKLKKDGTPSDAYNAYVTTRYTGGGTPKWLVGMGQHLMPVVGVERGV
jgi:hypothetical protein